MSVHKRQDSGAWEVVVGNVRRSSRRWTRQDALLEERKLQAEIRSPHSLSAAVTKWKDEHASYLRGKRQVLEHFNCIESFIGDALLTDAPDIAVKIKKASRHLAPATVNQRLAILRRICSLAFKEWHWIDKPIAERISLLTVQNERHIYLTRAQVEGLALACALPEARDLLIFSAFTGLRLSELFRAQSTDVWSGSLRVERRTKNGRPRSLPLHPRALTIAERLPLDITRVTLRQEWIRARTKQDLAHVHWHDLRHTFASWCLQANATLVELKELMGHQTIEMTMRYAHLAPNATRNVIERL